MKLATASTLFVAALAVASTHAHAAVSTYGFDGLSAGATHGTALNGQDNWASVEGTAGTLKVRNDGNVSGGANAGYMNDQGNWAYEDSSAHETLVRQNDGNFSYSVADGSTFTMEYDLLLGNTGRGGRVGLTDSSGNTIFSFGNSNSGGAATSRWSFSSIGGSTASSDQMPTSSSARYHLVATIDLAANGGDGSFSLAVAPDLGSGTWDTLADVTGFQNIDMHLGGIQGSDFTGLSLILFRNGGADTITLTTVATSAVPTPAALPAGVAMLGAMGLLRRRR